MKFLKNKNLLITGGTGSFGNAAVNFLLKNAELNKLIIFSRDENKQFEMQNAYKSKKLRFFLGDVRDESRLDIALKDVDYVIHAAALKQVPAAEYNPFECIKTNIHGTQALILSSIKNGVKKIIGLSTDKACNPINLYGATKLCAEKLLINANQYSVPSKTNFSVVRYGNVIASRGSVVPYFKDLILQGKKKLPLTHIEMTRFFISLNDAVIFVIESLKRQSGGEIFIPKMPSIYIRDLIKIIDKNIGLFITGIRNGEKINEVLCSSDEAINLYDNKNYFILYPPYHNKKIGKKVSKDFIYSSNSKKFLNFEKIKRIIIKNKIL
jgi:UDP-N-acetylglucosamine 4,6-dehydratase